MPNVPTPRAGAKPRPPRPRRPPVLRRLRERWKGQADLRTSRYDVPLSVLLLSGLTLDADEGPGLDVLIAIHETIEGWERMAGDVDAVRVPLGEVVMVSRRLEVAMELVRRGAGTMPDGQGGC